MKKILLVITLAFFSLQAQNYVKENFENNRPHELSICWVFPNTTFTGSTTITGKTSGQTQQLTSLKDQIGIISPWINLAAGNITFNHRLTTNTDNGTLRRFHVVLQNTTQTSNDTIFSYIYPNTDAAKQITAASVPINRTGIYRVFILFSGTGGNGRAHIDDINIPGTYASDPSSDCAPLSPTVDSDEDEVRNAEDDYSIDSARTYNNYYPASGNGTLLFEDLWPSKGDYDFNDLVIDYQFNHVTNAANKLVESQATFTVQAAGSSYGNGFAFSFDGMNANAIIKVEGSNLTDGVFSLTGTGIENGQTTAIIPVFDNVFKILTHPGVGTGVNTDPTAPKVAAKTITVVVTYKPNTLTLDDVSADKFNPFMVINKIRGKEVHLPDMKPTASASAEFFGKNDDDTTPGSGKYYKSKDNLPWAMNVVESIPHSIESIDFAKGYPVFPKWVVSKGANYKDWYKDKPGNRDKTKLYTK